MTDLPFGELLLAEQIHDVWRPKRQELVDAEREEPLRVRIHRCYTALKRAENTSKVTNLIFLSPFLSLVFIQFVLGEAIRASTPIVLVLIVAALLWQQAGRERQT